MTNQGLPEDTLHDLYQISVDEVAWCNALLEREDAQFARRAAFRTVFASFEALVSHAKQQTLLIHSNMPFPLSECEIMALREIEFQVTNGGDVIERNAKIRFLDNICFALKALSRAYDTSFVVNKDDGWDALTRSVKVRDRLMHPKARGDYRIGDQEILDLENAWKWFGRSLSEAVRWDHQNG